MESESQAPFMVPFAASLGVGIMITTGILMLLAPALIAVYLCANSPRRKAAPAM